MKLIFIILLFCNTSFGDELPKFIKQKAESHNLDARLVYAIAMVESNLNPDAVGKYGEVGLFQLRPEFHSVKPGDYKHNTEVAVKYLVYIKRRCYSKYGKAWFICYNIGPNRNYTIRYPQSFDYYRKVMKYYKQVQL